MKLTSIKTLGELKAENYVPKSIKEELKSNLIQSYKDGVQVFRPIMGYENTVIPQVENAILAKHNINFLGCRSGDSICSHSPPGDDEPDGTP